MRQPDDSWTEFDWEEALRESDEYAQRYFKLLKRFCDLPSSEELIAKHMGPDFQDQMLDYDFSSDADDWIEEISEAPNWTGESEDEGGEEDTDAQGRDAQVLFYENDPVFTAMRQAATGWCNVYAVILPAEAREMGLQALYYIGRALANLSYSIEDGSYDQPKASVAFAKRSLDSLNRAIGLVSKIVDDNPKLQKVLQTIQVHLIRCADGIADQIISCRTRENPMNE